MTEEKYVASAKAPNWHSDKNCKSVYQTELRVAREGETEGMNRCSFCAGWRARDLMEAVESS